MMASKIIVIGALQGYIKPIFEKISKLHSKNNFSFAIAAGDLFADPETATTEDEETISSLLNGQIDIPLPTYFTVGRHSLPPRIIERLESANGEVCHNLYFLGKRSTTKTSEGIRIVALGGTLDPNVTVGLSKESYLPFHTEVDAKSLHGANSADILITSNWPTSIKAGSAITLPEDTPEPPAEQCIADLCAKLRPRYHFSTTPNAFYEREPFFHQPTESAPDSRPITRFLSIASPNCPSKAKWLYAFSLDPTASAPTVLPPGTTPSPLSSKKRLALPDQQTYNRYANGDHGSHRPSHRHKRRNAPPPGPSECFFCLANPNLSTHLITSIATDTYLTTARGPLTLSTSYPSLNTPGHILLIPLAHSSTLSAITESESRASTYAELQRYRAALHSMLAATAPGKLGAVTWEVSRQRGVHFHWQFLPVPLHLIEKGLVEAAFRVEAENEKYPSFARRDVGDAVGEGEYFRIMVWRPGSVVGSKAVADGDGDEMNGKEDPENAGGQKDEEFQLVLPLVPELRFDIQFGRRVMAKLLGLEKRLDWKDCTQTEEEEKEEAERFKTLFKKWDFSLEE